ncbi:CAF17-like 4Fe-4S cluster assembly/insertion protein YgfZ [Tessaracoccus caeni]|uniref:CAF17-like 4Fe-4S cluster assembly/insertion protein YgfZ n=1 Tax=Tessaracoccus caeni TaxID=3031239 RepID=UPI0023DC2EC9|nr:folate-binding protein [Tessaracoccus caeni]MDF1487775.1 folate-binding protein [Tessaracoccus caeni]
MPVLVESGIDAGLAWHYGNPVAEARRIVAGEGVSSLANREALEVSGVDRLAFLHSLTTQHVEQLAPGVAVTALVLSPTGHIEHVLHGVDDGERFLAWTEPGRAEALVRFLDMMRFTMRVEVRRREDLSLAWAGHRVTLPETWARRDSDLGGVEVFVSAGEELPVDPSVGTWALEAARIAAGIPRIFVDTDFKTIPNEIGLLGTHLQKGCYRGQETVARVHTLGRPPRRLVQLHLDGSRSTLPSVGAPLLLNDRQVGFVGSSALHHELGPIALGLIKRNVPLDAELVVDGVAAAQEMLVDPEVGLHVRPVLR